jgi:hypothetical protein
MEHCLLFFFMICFMFAAVSPACTNARRTNESSETIMD